MGLWSSWILQVNTVPFWWLDQKLVGLRPVTLTLAVPQTVFKPYISNCRARKTLTLAPPPTVFKQCISNCMATNCLCWTSSIHTKCQEPRPHFKATTGLETWTLKDVLSLWAFVWLNSNFVAWCIHGEGIADVTVHSPPSNVTLWQWRHP